MQSFGIEYKPAILKNPQVKALLECLYGALSIMLRTAGFQVITDLDPMDIEQFIIVAALAIPFIYHNILGCYTGAVDFGQDILFDLSYMAG